MDELDTIIVALKQIIKKENLNVSDESIFDKAVMLYCNKRNTERKDNQNAPKFASDKQIALLKRLGVPIKEGLTMKEASSLIQNNKGDF